MNGHVFVTPVSWLKASIPRLSDYSFLASSAKLRATEGHRHYPFGKAIDRA